MVVLLRRALDGQVDGSVVGVVVVAQLCPEPDDDAQRRAFRLTIYKSGRSAQVIVGPDQNPNSQVTTICYLLGSWWFNGFGGRCPSYEAGLASTGFQAQLAGWSELLLDSGDHWHRSL